VANAQESFKHAEAAEKEKAALFIKVGI